MNAQNQHYRDEYIVRINKVIDYIQNNLNSQLDLETLARIAYFSKFHFHRIFTAMIGETLNFRIMDSCLPACAKASVDRRRNDSNIIRDKNAYQTNKN